MNLKNKWYRGAMYMIHRTPYGHVMMPLSGTSTNFGPDKTFKIKRPRAATENTAYSNSVADCEWQRMIGRRLAGLGHIVGGFGVLGT